MSATDLLATFGTVKGELAVGGMPLSLLAARVGSTPFFAYDRRLLTDRVAMLRSVLPDGLDLTYAMKANPMPAVVQHLAGLVDSIDVASAGEMAVALDTGMPAERISFAGPGKTAAELRRAVAAGIVVELESVDRGPPGARGRQRPRASGRASRSASTRTSPSRARACGWAAGRSSSAPTPSRCPTSSPSSSGADVDLLGLPRVRRLAEPARRDHRRGPAPHGRPRRRPRRPAADPGALPQPRRRLRHPVLRRRHPARPRRGRRQPGRPARRPDRGPPAGGAHGGRARPLHRRRVRRLRHRGRRPQGLARQDLPRRRRRHAPPARRLGQPRPGHPPELPAGRRQPGRGGGGRDRDRRRLPVHPARPARRRRRAAAHRGRRPRRRSSRRGPTASPPAPPQFLGHPAPAEVLV